MILPLYIFTLIFVACPLIYMVALSFATPGEVHGVQWIFTLDNYRKLLEPVYLDTFVQSFQLAITSTGFYHPDRVSVWLFYGEITSRRQKESYASSYASLLGEFPDQTLRLDHHPSEKRRSEFCAEKAWLDREAAENHVQLPGNHHWYDICTAAIYDFIRIFQCGKNWTGHW